MRIETLIGKRIECIYVLYGEQDGWLDTADVFINLGDITIGIPFQYAEEVWLRELETGAKPILPDLNGLTIVDIIYQSDIDRLDDKALIELSDGSVIQEITMAPKGIGAGLRVYDSIAKAEERYGIEYRRVSVNGVVPED